MDTKLVYSQRWRQLQRTSLELNTARARSTKTDEELKADREALQTNLDRLRSDMLNNLTLTARQRQSLVSAYGKNALEGAIADAFEELMGADALLPPATVSRRR
jgi:hypothetical protein